MLQSFSNFNISQMITPTKMTRDKNIISSLKISFSLLIVFLFSSSIFAQDQYLWTGDGVDNNWTNANNWKKIPTSGPLIYDGRYPGQFSPENDVAIFTNYTNKICRIDKDCSTSSTALRVGGVIVQGYLGQIIQNNNNRFIIAENYSGVWNSGAVISTDIPSLVTLGLNGSIAYRAHFQFDPTDLNAGFYGSSIHLPSPPSIYYAVGISVRLTVVSGVFRAPKDQLLIRQDAVINASSFENVYQGTVTLSGRSGGTPVDNYDFNGVTFWDLQVNTDGGSSGGVTKNFNGGTCIVANDFRTAGVNGLIPSSSAPIIMNGLGGTEIHIKNDLIVGNILATASASYTPANDFGDLVLVLNGDALVQHISQPYTTNNFAGILPSLKIDKSVGNVEITGPVTFNNTIEFAQGILYPNTPSTIDGVTGDITALSNDVLVLNSNTTIIGASDASFCHGPIRVRTGKTIELPVGKGSIYRPATIEAISGVSTGHSIINMYTAEYFQLPIGSSTPVTSFESPTLITVTNCEIWAIDKHDTSSDPWTFDLGLSFDPTSCSSSLIYDDLCKVAVVRWDNSENQWVSHGNNGLFPTASNGDQTIQTALNIINPDFELSPTRPDLFTFGKLEASVCIADPCEVHVCVDYCQEEEFIKFNPNIVYGPGSIFVGIFWDFGDGATSTDLNPIHEYMSDGVHMVTVTVSAIKDGINCTTTYTFGIFYNSCTLPVMEMIRQTNNNPTKDNKAVKTLSTEGSDANLMVTPNPSGTGLVQFSLATKEQGNFDYVITNNLGQTVLIGTMPGNEKTTINTSKLIAGSYIMSVQLLDKKVTKQFMIVQ